MIKRIFDIALSIVGLILFGPIILLLMVWIRYEMGAPVFFCQLRPGKDGAPFKMVKFRSMKDEIGSNGTPLPDADRVSSFGAKLRSSSADELPELWNVLKGDMSIVGPRPLLMEYLPLYSPQQARRHEVRPGITGWAQINGRNNLSWSEKFSLDIWYLDNRTIWLDLRIIALTIKRVITQDGISAKGEVTMTKFRGNP